MAGPLDYGHFAPVWRALRGLPAGALACVTLDSRGGDLAAALHIAAALRRAAGRGVAVRVSVPPGGCAMSAATALLVSASPGGAVLGEDSRVMVHWPRAEPLARLLDRRPSLRLAERRAARALAELYAARSGESVWRWLRVMARGETWGPAGAVRAGLADRVE